MFDLVAMAWCSMLARVSARSVRYLRGRAPPLHALSSSTSSTHPFQDATKRSPSLLRALSTLLTELDGLDARRGVFVLAATNRPDMLDPAMCRPGRLDKLLYVDLPAPEERAEIIRTLLAGSRTRSRVPLLSPQVGKGAASKSSVVTFHPLAYHMHANATVKS
jgi:SpoVK/Ycf46/Vps4 family AAA+-type ATPase